MENKTYKISVEEILERVISIEASSLDEALEKVKEMYNDEEIVLDSGDYQDVSFKSLEEDN